MDESSMTQNRRSRRSNVLMAAAIETHHGSANVTLRNLSADGALVEGSGIPLAGEPVVFRKKDPCSSHGALWLDHTAGALSGNGPIGKHTPHREPPSAPPRSVPPPHPL